MSGGTVTVRLEGGEELLAKLRALDLNVKEELRDAGLAAAERIRATAEGMAPGPHIRLRVARQTATMVALEIGPDKEHWYYKFFETGARPHEIVGDPTLSFEGHSGRVVTRRVRHPGMAASPFLRPAMDAEEGGARDEFGSRLRARIERG